MGLTADFLRNPHQFANAHSLYPYADPVTNVAHMKSLSLNDGSTFTQVQGDNKVAYLEILPAAQVNPLPSDMTKLMSYTNDRDLWVMRITYDRPSPKAVPTYYLPWQKDYMMRIKLKPSPKHPATEKGQTLVPDVFVTAALQGCSIMVSGEPDLPVVYHLNAASTKGPNEESFGGEVGEFDIAAASKIQKMTQMYNAARAQFPKEGPKGHLGTRGDQGAYLSRGAHVTDYMMGIKANLNTAIKSHYARLGTIHTAAVFGTVFGVRKDGQWTFYRQTRTRLTYTPPQQRKDSYLWVDPVCVRFWP